jgi:hypothetical protein
MTKEIATLLLALAGIASQNCFAEVRARTDEEMEQRANAKFRVKVLIAHPRQACAAFQAELVQFYRP